MQQTIDPAVIEQVQRHAAAQKRRRQAVDAFMRVLAHVVLLLLSFMALIPAIWMISSSLKAPT
ncbi:MAG: hypothetical protein KDE01_28990, partial [Caldilineaceae bacterium]|nr:hypothetical protein [Caldilineaceae bacterium]